MSLGSCYCGSVTFTTPQTSLWCGHCHCTMCQRAHGAGFVTWVGYPEDKVDNYMSPGQILTISIVSPRIMPTTSPEFRGFMFPMACQPVSFLWKVQATSD